MVQIETCADGNRVKCVCYTGHADKRSAVSQPFCSDKRKMCIVPEIIHKPPSPFPPTSLPHEGQRKFRGEGGGRSKRTWQSPRGCSTFVSLFGVATFHNLPWVPEVFLACGGNFQCWLKADTSSAVGRSYEQRSCVKNARVTTKT